MEVIVGIEIGGYFSVWVLIVKWILFGVYC